MKMYNFVQKFALTMMIIDSIIIASLMQHDMLKTAIGVIVIGMLPMAIIMSKAYDYACEEAREAEIEEMEKAESAELATEFFNEFDKMTSATTNRVKQVKAKNSNDFFEDFVKMTESR